jgi:hypothetical protein
MPERLRQRGRHEFFKTVEEAVGDLILRLEQQDSATAAAVAEVERGEQNPFVAAHRLLGSGALLREWLETLGGRT